MAKQTDEVWVDWEPVSFALKKALGLEPNDPSTWDETKVNNYARLSTAFLNNLPKGFGIKVTGNKNNG